MKERVDSHVHTLLRLRQTDRQVNSALFSILSIINRTHRLSSYKGEFVRFSMQKFYEEQGVCYLCEKIYSIYFLIYYYLFGEL